MATVRLILSNPDGWVTTAYFRHPPRAFDIEVIEETEEHWIGVMITAPTLGAQCFLKRFYEQSPP